MPSHSNVTNAYQAIPSIEVLLQRDSLRRLAQTDGHAHVRNALRDATTAMRESIARNTVPVPVEDIADWICNKAVSLLQAAQQPTLQSVFNLTGTVLHTNLGRAVLPTRAIEAIARAAAEPVTIEYNLETGQRGHRDAHVNALLCELTGAEAVCVVNNNAAAVMLTLNSMAQGREVAVSRGELIEIGGAFRMPDIMTRSGCQLVEVGTTNRTHLTDYANAIGERTAALMIVHPSNYSIQGFTGQPPRADIANLAHQNNLVMIDDMGSGTLIDLEQYGLPHEYTVRESLAAGADLVTFSGDKLLGGPQAGIIAGRADLIERINSNPMKRAMRVDKLIMAALQAALSLYRNPETLPRELPVLRLLTRPLADIDACARRILTPLTEALAANPSVENIDLVDCHSQIGSGALPGDTLPSRAIRLQPANGSVTTLNHWRTQLRQLPKPVIGRVQDGFLLLDVRTLEDETGFIDQLPHWTTAFSAQPACNTNTTNPDINNTDINNAC